MSACPSTSYTSTTLDLARVHSCSMGRSPTRTFSIYLPGALGNYSISATVIYFMVLNGCLIDTLYWPRLGVRCRCEASGFEGQPRRELDVTVAAERTAGFLEAVPTKAEVGKIFWGEGYVLHVYPQHRRGSGGSSVVWGERSAIGRLHIVAALI